MGDKHCKACDKDYDSAEPDPCLGYLPGVSHACCGHGDYGNAYVVIGGEPHESCVDRDNFVCLYGIPALEFFDLIKMAEKGHASSDGLPLPYEKFTDEELEFLGPEVWVDGNML